MVVITSEVDGLVGSSGSVIPGTKIKLVDVKGKEVTSHETRGELLVQSPSVVLGYFGNEKATAETFVWDDDGRWLKTGDEVLVRKSSLGHEHLVVVDRIKELIKVKVRIFLCLALLSLLELKLVCRVTRLLQLSLRLILWHIPSCPTAP